LNVEVFAEDKENEGIQNDAGDDAGDYDSQHEISVSQPLSSLEA
jgi:hypothetical protein